MSYGGGSGEAAEPATHVIRPSPHWKGAPPTLDAGYRAETAATIRCTMPSMARF
jgi:hypothetical protein